MAALIPGVTYYKIKVDSCCKLAVLYYENQIVFCYISANSFAFIMSMISSHSNEFNEVKYPPHGYNSMIVSHLDN